MNCHSSIIKALYKVLYVHLYFLGELQSKKTFLGGWVWVVGSVGNKANSALLKLELVVLRLATGGNFPSAKKKGSLFFPIKL